MEKKENIPQEMENKLLLPVDRTIQMRKKKAHPDSCGSQGHWNHIFTRNHSSVVQLTLRSYLSLWICQKELLERRLLPALPLSFDSVKYFSTMLIYSILTSRCSSPSPTSFFPFENICGENLLWWLPKQSTNKSGLIYRFACMYLGTVWQTVHVRNASHTIHCLIT